MSGSLTDVETQVDRIEAFVAIPAHCGTTTGGPSPPATTQSPTLIGTLVSTHKNTTPGPVGFHALMDLVTGGGVNFFLFGHNWADLEPSPGTFNFGGSLVQPLTDMLAWYPQFAGFGFVINVLNGSSRLTPADLNNLPFDNPAVLSRFDALIDALVAQPLSAKLGYILVGNEVDSMLTDPAGAAAFVTFYQRAVNRIHLKLPQVKVSTIVSAGGATGRTPKLFADLSALSDFVTYTYYPTAGTATGTWVMRPPSEVKPDLDWLAALACDKPFAFTEIGYASSIDIGSSESQQADFVREVFADLDTYRQQGRLAFVHYQSLYDLLPEVWARYTIRTAVAETPSAPSCAAWVYARTTSTSRARPGTLSSRPSISGPADGSMIPHDVQREDRAHRKLERPPLRRATRGGQAVDSAKFLLTLGTAPLAGANASVTSAIAPGIRRHPVPAPGRGQGTTFNRFCGDRSGATRPRP